MDKRLWNEKTKATKPYLPGEQPKNRCIKLNTNENPYPPSKAVEDVIRNFNYECLRKYPDPSASELKCVIARKNDISEDMVFVGNGSDEVLAFAFRAFFDSDRRVAFADITYSFYPVYARSLDIPYERIKVRDDFCIDTDEYVRYNGGVVIANPNAPTGILTPFAEIERIVAANNGRLVIIDEAYIDFGGVSAVPLVKKYDNLLVVQTVSKSRALAGIRIGYAIGSSSLVKALECVRDTINSYTVDSLAQAVAAAAISDDEWFEETCKKIMDSREILISRLGRMGFSVLPTSANFVFATSPDFDARRLYEELKKKGILIRYFDLPGIDRYLRITVGTPEENEVLCDALEVLTADPGKVRI